MTNVVRCCCVSIVEQGGVFDLTYDFARRVTEAIQGAGPFQIHSISPTPIAIAELNAETTAAIHASLSLLRGIEGARLVVTVGDLWRGAVGGIERFDYTHVGRALEVLRLATVELPETNSWIDSEIANTMNVAPDNLQELAGRIFFLW